jgi:hypothetical protein
MTRPARWFLIGSGVFGLFFWMSLAAAPAQAGHGWWRFHGRFGVVVPPPSPCCYGPPVVVAPPPPVEREPIQLGLDVQGVAQSAPARGVPLGGFAAALQLRTSSHSMLAFELLSLGAEGRPDRARRDELDGLLVGRLYLWDAALAPYLELAGGAGRASVERDGISVTASQLIGRIGVGLELRLGRHLALEGEIAQVHRLHLDDEPSHFGDLCCAAPTDHHERATEIRGGLAFRF